MLKVETPKMPVSAILGEVFKINRVVGKLGRGGGGSLGVKVFYHGLQDVSWGGGQKKFTYNIRGASKRCKKKKWKSA